MKNPSDWLVELNCFARGVCVDRGSGAIASSTPLHEVIATARHRLLHHWKEDRVAGFVPARAERETPDEVVVRGADGRALYRRTIIDEKMERWFAET